MPNFSIDYLVDCPQHAEQAAAWVLADRANFYPFETQADARRRIEDSLHRGAAPFFLVVHTGAEPAGIVGVLKQNAPPGYEKLTPWLANLYVAQRFRGQGLEVGLIERALEEARQQGFHEIYTWTDSDKEWYQALGWQVTGTSIFGRRYVGILRWDLTV